eukprot:scaffold308_cov327-Pavlova_lutheri.AAC.11
MKIDGFANIIALRLRPPPTEAPVPPKLALWVLKWQELLTCTPYSIPPSPGRSRPIRSSTRERHGIVNMGRLSIRSDRRRKEKSGRNEAPSVGARN